MTRRTRVGGLALAAALALGAAACSSSNDTSTGTTNAPNTTGATGTTTGSSGSNGDATRRFDATVQAELNKVGCYAGGTDGIIGPETDAAIVAFQQASGITVDGELGPQTDAALSKAAAAGTKVCGGNPPATGAPTPTTPPTGPSCTAMAILAAAPVPNATLTAYVCSGTYAAGIISVDGGQEGFILQANGNAWQFLGQQPCGAASAGLPPVILEDGCTNSGGGGTSTSTTAGSTTTSATSTNN